ncbi:hypothetical protein [Kutzneria kofuensis]|uniref:Uncharacterized protein n=1 Tax=Kutzneria kofuensis TaxID=103725 RepID=A0A7W9NFW1_9PSEU|nr:hypothetical protein [Kutzneria kofuensis]MBB5891020.1 hypothetical protein [Kutzneria kofuensis]
MAQAPKLMVDMSEYTVIVAQAPKMAMTRPDEQGNSEPMKDWQTKAIKYTVDLVLMERPRPDSDWSPLPIPIRADLLAEPAPGVTQGAMVALNGVRVTLKTSKVTDSDCARMGHLRGADFAWRIDSLSLVAASPQMAA